MGGFPIEFINELKARNDIVSTIQKYVPLKKKGRQYWACCPFHFEKTPSFAVNEDEQYYHCFGCGASGNVIKFIEKIDSLDYFDAIKRLAEESNMALPNYTNDENLLQLKKKKELYLKILTDAGRYYYKNLRLPEAKLAQEYVINRGLDAQTIKDFGIGYSLGWNEVVEYLKSLGYTAEDMIGAGICEKGENRIYDMYGKRLIFPIINSYGNVVGFSARVLGKSDFAKYKNTAQTLLFDKSKCVYNINHIKELKNIGDLKEIIIVEGQMDVISLYKHGIKNAVACMGTALTIYHAKELKRFSNKVVVCFDGDGAGKKATLRSLEILVNTGLEVYVMALPNGVDPDEYVQQNSKEEFLQLVNNAKYWVEFLIYDFSTKYNLNKPEEKNLFIQDCLNVIKTLSSSSEQDIYLNIVKDITNIAISILRSDMNKQTEPQNVVKTETVYNDVPNRDNANIKASKFVIASLLHKKPYAKPDENILQNLKNPDYIKVYNYIKQESDLGRTPIVSALFEIFDVDNNAEIYDIINFVFESSEDNEDYYKDCVKHLIKQGLEVKQKELMMEIAKEPDLDERRNLSKELQKIILKLKGNN